MVDFPASHVFVFSFGGGGILIFGSSFPPQTGICPQSPVDTCCQEKNPGWLGYIGDDKLPSYIGIIINHYKDPY